jgi:hypothetical protein
MGEVVVPVGVFTGICVPGGFGEPVESVGTTTPPELSTWASATELPSKQAKLKLLKKTNFSGDDINHPQWEIGRDINTLNDEKFCF